MRTSISSLSKIAFIVVVVCLFGEAATAQSLEILSVTPPGPYYSGSSVRGAPRGPTARVQVDADFGRLFFIARLNGVLETTEDELFMLGFNSFPAESIDVTSLGPLNIPLVTCYPSCSASSSGLNTLAEAITQITSVDFLVTLHDGQGVEVARSAPFNVPVVAPSVVSITPDSQGLNTRQILRIKTEGTQLTQATGFTSVHFVKSNDFRNRFLFNAPGGPCPGPERSIFGFCDFTIIDDTTVEFTLMSTIREDQLAERLGTYDIYFGWRGPNPLVPETEVFHRAVLLNAFTLGDGCPALTSEKSAKAQVCRPPLITGFDPTSVEAGSGEFTLRILGSGFVDGAVVEINNDETLPVRVVSATEARRVIDASAVSEPGILTLVIVNPDGQRSNDATFPVTGPALQISRISPVAGSADDAPIELVIEGFGFTQTSEVLWDGQGVQPIIVNGRRLDAMIPENLIGLAGQIDVQVKNPDGSLSNIAKFLVEPATPAVTTVTPDRSPISPNDLPITIDGERFEPNAKVRLDGREMQVAAVTPGQIMAVIPKGFLRFARESEIKVVNPVELANRVSNPVPFIVEPNPSDLFIDSLEVKQNIQRVDSSGAHHIPLIAKKRTVLRVFARSSDSDFEKVDVAVKASNGGGSRLPGKAKFLQTSVSRVLKNPRPEFTNDTFNFLLPEWWINEGSIRLEAEIDPNRQAPETDLTGFSNNIASVGLSFQPGERLEIGYLPVDVRTLSKGLQTVPENHGGMEQFLLKTYPVAHKDLRFARWPAEKQIYNKMGIRLTQVAPISCGLEIFLGSVTG